MLPQAFAPPIPPSFSTVDAALVALLGENRVSWPTLDDRDAWDALAATSYGSAIRSAVAREAVRLLEEPMVLPTWTQALEYNRSGDRMQWEGRMNAIAGRLTPFTLAAAFEGEPAYLDGAANVLGALCQIDNWVLPAHRNYETDDSPGFDLGAAARGIEIAEALQILQPGLERLAPRLVLKIRRALRERVFEPFLRRDYWFTYPQGAKLLNNWTAVCSGGVLVAALAALDDEPEYQARIVSKAIWSLGFFLDSFGTAGSLDEGVSYWAYGLSYYVMAAQALLVRTNGTRNLLADPLWRQVASFPLRVRLHGETFVNFSDCDAIVKPPAGWLAWTGQQLDLPALVDWAKTLFEQQKRQGSYNRSLPYTLRDLFWTRRLGHSAEEVESLPLAVFLPDVNWGVARAQADDDALVVAIKGGHNGEAHNHNDGGSFVVHCFGEAFVDEIGKPTYNRQFFGSERYEHIAARSLGHAVPYPNETEQGTGDEFSSRLIRFNETEFDFDLTGLYPASAGLKSLVREVRLRRDRELGLVELKDIAIFENEGATLGMQLIVKGHTVELLGPGRARIGGVNGVLDVDWDASQAEARVETIPTTDRRFVDEKGESRLRRLWFDVTVRGHDAQLSLMLWPIAARG